MTDTVISASYAFQGRSRLSVSTNFCIFDSDSVTARCSACWSSSGTK